MSEGLDGANEQTLADGAQSKVATNRALRGRWRRAACVIVADLESG